MTCTDTDADDDDDGDDDRIERCKSRFLLSPHYAANCLQHVRSSGPGEIVCKSRAAHRALITQHVVCHVVRSAWYEGTGQLLTLTELKSHFV